MNAQTPGDDHTNGCRADPVRADEIEMYLILAGLITEQLAGHRHEL
jgi:hypothetical protein